MCSLLCQLARGISGYSWVRLCVVDVPVWMRAYYLTPQDALFSILYVWMTAMANYFSEMVKRRLVCVPRVGDAGLMCLQLM